MLRGCKYNDSAYGEYVNKSKLLVNATTSSTSSDCSSAPVSIEPFGDVLKLIFKDSGKYAGILGLPVLRKLLDEGQIKLTGTLMLSPPPKLPKKKAERYSSKKKAEQYSPRESTVRISVYGVKQDRLTMGNLLSDAGLYLQHPLVEECGTDLEYCNPHFLLRPGSQMPDLAQLSISPDTPTRTSSEVLTEVNRNRFIQLFDLANDDGIRLHFQPSCRLSSNLKQ